MSDTVTIPGYKTGTWTIDPVHSEVSFAIRHLMISKVRGVFHEFEGTITTAENPLESSVDAHVQVASIDTKDPNRDGHLRTGDFFLAEEYPTIDFVSTGVRQNGDDFVIDGNLTIKGVTKPVTFDFEFGGFQQDPYGNYKAGASARAEIDRGDFGLSYNATLESGGVLLGDKVTITLDLQAALNA